MIDGRFELLEQLGTGGMSTVWRARDVVLHREVALKEVRPADPRVTDATPGSVRVQHERVLREARALARLRHPNVVTIHHIVEQDPYPWLVMELVPGPSLQKRLETGPLDPREAARLGRDVLAALRAAHAAGIHHRDVKPANILLREGPENTTTAVLTDFGIAGLAGVTPLTNTGEMVGSPEYMAPERIRGADDAPASDLWSLGMTLYVAVEGASPMRRATSLATLAAVLDESVPEPVDAGPLAPVLTRLLVSDPNARPDADELDALLAEAAGGPAPASSRSASAGSVSSGSASAGAAPSGSAPGSPGPDGPDSPSRGQGSGSRADGLPATARLEAGPDAHSGAGTSARTSRRRLRPVPLVAAAAVVAVALIAAALYRGLTSSSGSDEASADGTSPTATVTATVGGPSASGSPGKSPGAKSKAEEEAGGSGSGSKGRQAAAADDDTEASASPGSTPEEEAAADEEETADSPDTADPETYANSWIAKLDQTWAESGTEMRDQHLAAVRKEVPDAQVLFSTDFESMGSGYWVIYVPQRFGSGLAAVDYCAKLGRTTKGSCMGRYLSHNTAHQPLMCEPDGEGGTTGRCTGP
ncbi:serine/threonine-protein kinase [Streptomyces phyllanthi]|nr:serine/threonine-protein kinase [Streptomyces phyllanthi]